MSARQQVQTLAWPPYGAASEEGEWSRKCAPDDRLLDMRLAPPPFRAPEETAGQTHVTDG
jgi:hypothetical protein